MATRQTAVEFLTSTKIGEKGQLTVPKQFREDLGLRTGAPFTILRIGDGLILLPEQDRFGELCAKISSVLQGAALDESDLLATLPEARRRVFIRLYGAKLLKKPAKRRAPKK
jgi:AbrB family looped-hinge helix DNA binding protein